MADIIVIFFNQRQKLPSHMDKISKHINSSNNKIHSYDQMSKMIVNLGNKKFENNNNSTFKLRSLKHSLLMIIVNTPEKYVPNVDQKLYMRKVLTYSVNSSSILFSCSIRAMY